MCDAVANPERRSFVHCAVAEADFGLIDTQEFSSAAHSKVLSDSLVQRRCTRTVVSARARNDWKSARALAAVRTLSQAEPGESWCLSVYVFINANASFQSGQMSMQF